MKNLDVMIRKALLKGIVDATLTSGVVAPVGVFNALKGSKTMMRIKFSNFGTALYSGEANEAGICAQLWADVVTSGAGSDDARSTRLRRYLPTLAQCYDDVLPEYMRGNGFSDAFKVFFITDEQLLSLSSEMQTHVANTQQIFRGLFFVELLFISDTINGLRTDDLFKQVIAAGGTSSVQNINKIMGAAPLAMC